MASLPGQKAEGWPTVDFGLGGKGLTLFRAVSGNMWDEKFSWGVGANSKKMGKSLLFQGALISRGKGDGRSLYEDGRSS